MAMFIRGKLRPESENPVSRFTQALYLPVLRLLAVTARRRSC